MITDFLKSMFPVDLNPPPGVPYIWCRVWGSREVGKLSHHPITPKPYHPKTLSPYLLNPAS
jgi:hypothetical protein